MRFLCISPFYMAIGMIRWKMLFMEKFMRALDRHMADNFFTGKRWRCMKRRFRHTKSRRSFKAYIYCAYKAYTKEEYELFLLKNTVYPKVHRELMEELQTYAQEKHEEGKAKLLEIEKIKSTYRRNQLC